jgi:hypothetical protein
MNKSFRPYLFLAAGGALLFLMCGGQSPYTLAPLSGFHPREEFGEQEITFRFDPEVRIYINAPDAIQLDQSKPIGIVLYALPNGNTIEQTAGKNTNTEDDWKFEIQHIAAQTRFLRRQITTYNLVVAYLETVQHSWPAWKRDHADYLRIIPQIADTVLSFFEHTSQTFLILSGHSGGGSFIFGYLEAFPSIPQKVKRIVFLDSNYGYQVSYGQKLAKWLKTYPNTRLFVIAYNDSIALYRGKPFVSRTGGTWYRSKMMMNDLTGQFSMKSESDSSFIKCESEDQRIDFILKKNPQRQILHTRQVELNGFIHSLLYDTPLVNKTYTYYGERIYQHFIGREVPGIRPMHIPVREPKDISGSEFMQSVADLSFDERESLILREMSKGNIPDFLRKTVSVHSVLQDATGKSHELRLEVMPDYLAVGSNDDFCRVPMGPQTAQKLADQFSASLPTAKIVDEIYHQSVLKLNPVSYYPLGDRNEKVAAFIAHNQAINDSLIAAGFLPGVFIEGIKKDVIISNKLADPSRTHHVTIYGWHRPDGTPIQPVTNIHIDSYVDYSHGIRLINGEVILDGIPRSLDSILKDPVLYKLLTNEDGPLKITKYHYR